MLNNAEETLRATVDADASLTDVRLARLVARYEMGHFEEVLNALPAVQVAAESLGMLATLAKSRILEGTAFKGLGRVEESLQPLVLACESEPIRRSATLRAFAYEHLADSCLLSGRRSEAGRLLRSVANDLKNTDAPTAQALLKLIVGQSFRIEGKLERALLSYRRARDEWRVIGTDRWVAYSTLLIAEVLLLAGREREGEAEVRGVLPIIDRLKLEPEGASALTILRESVRRRQTNRAALQEVASRLRHG